MADTPENDVPSSESLAKPKSRFGCLLLPALLSLSAITAGAWMMDSWATLAAPLKALAVLLIVFGSILLLPVVLIFAFKIWMARLKSTIDESLGGIGDTFSKIAAETKAIYEAPQEYRTATPVDFSAVDIAFYDATESAFRDRGYRKLGDIVNKAFENLGKPSPPLRIMLSSAGNTIGACYHFKSGEHSYRIFEATSCFTDDTCLVTANTATLDLSTPPPKIHRHHFPEETTLDQLLATHERELAKLLNAPQPKTAILMQTLNEVITQQMNLHEIKRAFLASKDYLDEAAVQRVAETHKTKSSKTDHFLAAMAKARIEAEEKKARDAARRGPDFQTGTGTPEPEILLEGEPEAPLSLEEESAGLGDMLRNINAAQRERDAQVLSKLPIGASRFGGLPDLPPNVPWPTYQNKKIPFLAQIDLSTVPQASALPADGWLFFFGLFDNEPDHKPDPISVFLYRGTRTDLRRALRPSDSDLWPDWTGTALYEIIPLTPRLPGTPADEKDRNRAFDEKRKKGDPTPRDAGYLFGTTAGVDFSAGDVAENLDRSGNDWINLLTLRSVGNMQWSDAGYLNFVIRRTDLQKFEFSNTCASIWSS